MIDLTTQFRAKTKVLIDGGSSNNVGHNKPTSSRFSWTATKLSPCSNNFRIYSNNTYDILNDIRELRNLILDKRKDYIFCSNYYSMYGTQCNFMTESDRNLFDREVDIAIKQCTKLIKELETQLGKDRSLRKDELKHLQLVARFLSAGLKETYSIVSQLRALHLRKSERVRQICRLANLVDLYETQLQEASKEETRKQEEYIKKFFALHQSSVQEVKNVESDGWEWDEKNNFNEKENISQAKESNTTLSNESYMNRLWLEWLLGCLLRELGKWKMVLEELTSIIFEINHFKFFTFNYTHQIAAGMAFTKWRQIFRAYSIAPSSTKGKISIVDENSKSLFHTDESEELSKSEQIQLITENKVLFDRLSRTDKELDTIESHLSEIQRLQITFGEKIVEQERDIDSIHTHYITTLDNLEVANHFIREAIKNQANRRVTALFCLIVLTLTLLFLDWYNP